MINFYHTPFQKEFENVYHVAWLEAEKDIKEKGYLKARTDFNKIKNSNNTLAEFHYLNGYFCYLCQYANDNKLI